MKHKILLIAALAMIPLFTPAKAEAREYCREYTKTIRIGGKVEVGYGQACKRGDTWEVVKLSGSSKAKDRVVERIYDDLDDGDVRVVIVNRDYRYNYPRTYYTTHVEYSKPHYYKHAYKHNYGHYKKAKNHYKKHHKHCNGHH